MSSVRRDGTPLDAGVAMRIDRLMARYASAIDNGEFEEWPPLFVDDGEYRIVTRTDFEAGRDFGIWYCNNRAMLEDRVNAIRSVNVYEPHVYRHVLGPTEVLSVDGDVVACETSYLLVRTSMEGDMQVFSAGRYVDRVTLRDALARLQSRVVVTDSARYDTLVALPL